MRALKPAGAPEEAEPLTVIVRRDDLRIVACMAPGHYAVFSAHPEDIARISGVKQARDMGSQKDLGVAVFDIVADLFEQLPRERRIDVTARFVDQQQRSTL